MKRFYKISSNVESKPIRLLAAVVLAALVMLFINGFIGSMGGIPAFIAFLMTFYLLRTVMSTGNRISHQLAMNSRREIGYLLIDYGAGYLLLWTLFRGAFALSKVTGWGNINGATAIEYLKELLDTSLLEEWAYFFVGILMFSFVMSLFPLVILRGKSNWTTYALVDATIFALICEGIGGVLRCSLGERPFGRDTCLIDYLRLCENMKDWQKIASLLGVLLFAVAVSVFVFFFASYCYGPKPGQVGTDTSGWQPGTMERSPEDKKLLRRNLILTGCGILILGIIMGIIWFGPEEETVTYEKVAEYLTEDSTLGPMIYKDQIYIPVDESLALYEKGRPQGYLVQLGEDCDSLLYQKTVADLLYTDTSGGTDYVQVYGANVGSFAPVEEVEQNENWQQDSVFLLWDEEWVRESAYSHEPTGYTVCDRGFVESLERRFGKVKYEPSDFLDYDAYFSLCGYTDMDRALTEELTPGDWVGCILVKDNKFYYGNYKNQITGLLLQELLDILGGY